MNIEIILNILTIVLLGGTIFAWYQFYQILVNKKDSCAMCQGVQEEGLCKEANPFTSKCFIGAVFFTIALALAIYAIMLV